MSKCLEDVLGQFLELVVEHPLRLELIGIRTKRVGITVEFREYDNGCLAASNHILAASDGDVIAFVDERREDRSWGWRFESQRLSQTSPGVF